AFEEAQSDAKRVDLGDALDHPTLHDAVTAPDAADDQSLHLARESRDELPLRGRDRDRVIRVAPAALLLAGAGLHVRRVPNGVGEFAREIFRVEHAITCEFSRWRFRS